MTIKINNERQYIENGNAYIFFDGEYNYVDGFGCKSYKSINGLNKHIAKVAKMANREAVTVID